MARVTKAASHRVVSSGGLSEDEIELLYGATIREAEGQFGSDLSFLTDVVTSSSSDET